MAKAERRIRVGITMGDPAGIGPEVLVKALNRLSARDAEFVIIGDRWVLEQSCRLHPVAAKVSCIDAANVDRTRFAFGAVRPEHGRASMEYLETALELLRAGKIDSLVTCPISKEAINLAGYGYSGHTPYFAEKTRTADPVMMLVNRWLRFTLVSQHVSLRTVWRQVTRPAIERLVRVTGESLERLFGIAAVRIVVCGLNPHNSDNGLIGDEELRIIRPAVEALRAARRSPWTIDGPVAADTAIRRAYRKEYDCLVAMYHDQALIPLKLLGSDSGVNITLGLPFVRTSPLHGTAFDIAGRNKADCRSMIAALRMALQCTRNQRKD